MPYVIVYQRADGLFDWKLLADNHEEMTGSVQGYNERNDALEGVARVAKAFTDGVSIEVEQAPVRD